MRLALLSGVAAVGLLAASDANATAYGGSTVTVKNLGITGLPGFGAFSFSGNSQAHLDNGLPTDVSHSTPVRTSGFTSSGTPVDVLMSCISTNAGQCTGGGGFGQNNFALHPGDLGDFSRADGIITNTRINVSSGGLGTDGGGRFRAVAEAKVGSDSGNAVSNPNTQRWTFATSFTTTATVSFSLDVDLLMQAILTGGEDVAAGASAGATFSLQFDFSPVTSTTSFTSGTPHHAELIADASAAVAVTTSPGSLSLDETDILCSSGCDLASFVNSAAAGGFDHITWLEVISPGIYNFIITTDVAAQATSVPAPEPATLSLLGVGLLGAGLAVRRRRKG